MWFSFDNVKCPVKMSFHCQRVFSGGRAQRLHSWRPQEDHGTHILVRFVSRTLCSPSSLDVQNCLNVSGRKGLDPLDGSLRLRLERHRALYRTVYPPDQLTTVVSITLHESRSLDYQLFGWSVCDLSKMISGWHISHDPNVLDTNRDKYLVYSSTWKTHRSSDLWWMKTVPDSKESRDTFCQ